ncbi:MAG: hypothetical protein QME75_11080 [Deltaproteobacteria bacterium]|nr:hypothetical protein [Deltaproteobacteria bacterium]
MKKIALLFAMLFIVSCASVQQSVQHEVVKASVNRGRLDNQEMKACTEALRQAGHKDVLRVNGGTSEYNHSTNSTMYYPRFLLSRGGWGTAVIKVVDQSPEPTLMVLDVKRYDR